MENHKVTSNPQVIQAQKEFDLALQSGNSKVIKEKATALSSLKAKVLKEWENSPEKAAIDKADAIRFHNRLAYLVNTANRGI